MKVAVITDQHFGARKSSQTFHNYFLDFYNEVFFPTLEKLKITTLIDMGDTFDNRRGIDFWALDWAKKHYYDRLAKMGIEVHTIVGNHTAYYKNTNNLTSVGLFLREYDNVKIYPNPQEVSIGGRDILFLPWINKENEKESLECIKNTSSKVAMGHLELKGFKVNHHVVMEHGSIEVDILNKFDKVFSGHFHTRSNNGTVYYLGNPYEIYWNDVNDARGFHILDLDTLETTAINNPFSIYKHIYYEDTPRQTFNFSKYQNKIVKVIVRKKSSEKDFEKFIDKLLSVNVYDLKVVENFEMIDAENIQIEESENTISILSKYIEESEGDFDKSNLKKLINEIYNEACEIA